MTADKMPNIERLHQLDDAIAGLLYRELVELLVLDVVGSWSWFAVHGKGIVHGDVKGVCCSHGRGRGR